jgi:hypothetical protein
MIMSCKINEVKIGVILEGIRESRCNRKGEEIRGLDDNDLSGLK